MNRFAVVKRFAAAVASLLLLALPMASPPGANAMPNVVVAALSVYAPAEVVVAEGTSLTFVNTDPSLHDVTAADTDEGGTPLFRSGTILTGTSPVAGVEDLEPSTYSFFCTVHEEMLGLLTVVDTPE